MKKIILTLIFTFTATGIFAQATPQNYNTGASTNEYILKQNFPNPFNEVTLIVFDLMTENYINLSVKDGNGKIIETLVDGIVESGTKSIFFKPKADLDNGKYICQMDVYSKDKSKIINSTKKEMIYDKNNAIVFKK